MLILFKFVPARLRYLFLFLFSLCGWMGVSVEAASAHKVIIHHDGYALNTNNNFRKVDGQPRMSIYRRNNADKDQVFTVFRKGNTFYFKNETTGKCLNAHHLGAGGPINVWPCNWNDPDQMWEVAHLGGPVRALKRKGTGFCLDNPDRKNEGTTHLWYCDGRNPNQRFVIENITGGVWNFQAIDVNNISGPQPLPTPNFSNFLVRSDGGGAKNSNLTLIGQPPFSFKGDIAYLPNTAKQRVYGGIQYIDVCNGPSGYRFNIQGKYTSLSNNLRIVDVDFKMKSRFSWSVNLFNQFIGQLTSYAWRDYSIFDRKVDRDTWEIKNYILHFVPTLGISQPVKFSAHIMVEGDGYRGPLYNVGGVINMGTIPVNECRDLHANRSNCGLTRK